MKKLISKWPDRLMSLFVSAVLVVSFFVPTNVLALKEMRIGGGGTGGSEGDPLDTNDAGGSGGGSDIHDDAAPSGTLDLLGFISDRYQILLVPEVLGGTLIFRIIVVEKSDLGLIDFRLEESHAP